MRGSYTVEAALLLPFLCLLLCTVITVTMTLYQSIAGFREKTELLRLQNNGTRAIRIERLLCEWEE